MPPQLMGKKVSRLLSPLTPSYFHLPPSPSFSPSLLLSPSPLLLLSSSPFLIFKYLSHLPVLFSIPFFLSLYAFLSFSFPSFSSQPSPLLLSILLLLLLSSHLLLFVTLSLSIFRKVSFCGLVV
jgi:hypothetical protein